MTSMTGYCYEEKSTEKYFVSVEIKSVNSRFLDLSVNMPPFLNSLENRYRKKISEKIFRGKVDVFVRIKEFESDTKVVADTQAALSYYNAIKKVSDAIGYPEKIPLGLIISQNGVLNDDKIYDVDSYRAILDELFDSCLQKLNKDKKREGENLYKDLQKKLDSLEECAIFFKQWQPKMEDFFKNQITLKFTELLGEKIDENRILSETAAMLVKYTINEEIVRLFSHIQAMKDEMKSDFPGKKLDFICQEMNREINTIGSKNQFSEVSKVVIQAKDAIENIREQSKNVE